MSKFSAIVLRITLFLAFVLKNRIYGERAMRVKTFFRVLRVTSAVVLFFFVWTVGGAWRLAAWAATPEPRKTQQARTEKPQAKSAAERFQAVLEEVKGQAAQASVKAEKDEDDAAEMNFISAKKNELDGLAGEIRAELASTEKVLKDKGLPQETLNRHYRFTKNFEDNLQMLKTNLSDAEAAKTKADRKAKIEKVRLHLEQTQPKKRVQKLDPENLPFKTRKITKTREPYFKKEDFEKEFPKQKNKTTKLAFSTDGHRWPRIDIKEVIGREWARISANDELRISREKAQEIGLAGLNSAFRTPNSALAKKLLLVASNGSLTGLLSPKHDPVALPFTGNDLSSGLNPDATPHVNGFAFDTPNSELATLNLAAAATADPPTEDDLAENGIEIQFTDDIRAKAQELGCSVVKIFEFTKNEISFVPTYGSILGADMCLQTKECNSIDTSSLLISMLRSCSHPARYAHGTVEIPIDKVKNWVGGFSDSTAALTLMASGGIPVAAGTSGGTITKARFEHFWVELSIGYGPYSGRSSKLNPDKIWVPLDPSYKQFTYSEGLDLQAAVPFDAQAFANQIQSTAMVNETEGSVTNVDSTYIQTTMSDYQTQVQNYIDQNMPNATTDEVVGKKEIKKQELGILPLTLPYKAIVVGSKYSFIPDSLRHKVTFEVQGSSSSAASLSYTASIPELAGKRVTLSYGAATTNDEQVINNYGGIFYVPAYLVHMIPQIKIEGVTMATGNNTGLGNQQTFNMKFVSPSGNADSTVSNNVTVGAYYGIGINPNKTIKKLIDRRRAKLEAVQSTVSDSTIYTDEYIGELIYTTAMAYFFELDSLTAGIAPKYKIADLKHVSEAIVSKEVIVAYSWGLPLKIEESSMMIDVDRLIHSFISLSGDQEKERAFTISAGQLSSGLEHVIFEQMYQAKGISTIQALQLANSQGVPIYTLTSGNISSVLPKLQISSEALDDIKNAVNAGKTVVVPQQNITYYNWTGTGYMVMDSVTGSAAYMISTSLINGGYCIAAGGLPVVMLASAGSSGSSGSSHGCTILTIEHWFGILYFLGAMEITIGTGLLFLNVFPEVLLMIGLEGAGVGLAGIFAGIFPWLMGLFVLILAALVVFILAKALYDYSSTLVADRFYDRRFYGTGRRA
jgi:hypothetical protein